MKITMKITTLNREDLCFILPLEKAVKGPCANANACKSPRNFSYSANVFVFWTVKSVDETTEVTRTASLISFRLYVSDRALRVNTALASSSFGSHASDRALRVKTALASSSCGLLVSDRALHVDVLASSSLPSSVQIETFLESCGLKTILSVALQSDPTSVPSLYESIESLSEIFGEGIRTFSKHFWKCLLGGVGGTLQSDLFTSSNAFPTIEPFFGSSISTMYESSDFCLTNI